MFQRQDFGLSQGGGTAALSLDRAIPLVRTPRQPFGRLAEFSDRLQDIDLVPDLGARIGSREWWRGLVSCTVLCSAAIGLSPGLEPLPGHAAAPLGASEFDEVRAQSIAPLAWGADTGKRMAATDAVQPLNDTPERPQIDLSATLGQGDSFVRVLERAGVGGGEASRVAAMVGDAVDLSGVKPGTPMAITLGRRANRSVARPLDRLEFRANIGMKLAVERGAGGLSVNRLPVAVDRTPLRIQGRVGDSLYASARAAGAPAKTVEAYIRALSPKVPMGSIASDARFDMIVEHARAEDGQTQSGKLLYVGLERGNRATRMIEWNIGGRTEWFDAAGVGQKRGGMAQPVANARMSSGFGFRIHPLLGYSRFHKGVDYAAVHGTPIRAVSDGVVAFAGRNGGYGNFVKLSHAGPLGTGYGHMSRIAVSSGQRVVQGQVIGYVGSTGFSTGPHLHFEVYRNGAAVNPRAQQFASTSLLQGRELEAFRTRLRQMLAVDGRGSQGAGGGLNAAR